MAYRNGNGGSRGQTSRRQSQNNSGQQERQEPEWKRSVWSGSGYLNVAVYSQMTGEGNDQRETFNVSLRKRYRKGDTWEESRSLFPEELATASALLLQAFDWIADQTNRE